MTMMMMMMMMGMVAAVVTMVHVDLEVWWCGEDGAATAMVMMLAIMTTTMLP